MGGGGAERTVANLANYWCSKGWNITIVTFGSNEILDNDFYYLSDKISRINLSPRREINQDENTGIYLNVKRVLNFVRIIRDVQPDTVIGMMTGGIVLAALASLFPYKKRPFIIGSERTNPARQNLRPILTILRKYGYGLVDCIVSVTSGIEDWVLANTNTKKSVVIPNAIKFPLDVFEPKLDPSIVCHEGRKILLAVGRLSSEKQFELLINVFKKIANIYSDWDLVIAGVGPLIEALQSQVKDSGLKDRVFFTGRVGNISDWYIRANAYVLCSSFEGFPNSLLEAMAHGKPSVSFDCDTGPRDIIKNNINGLLVNDMTFDGLYDSLTKLIDDDLLMDFLSNNAIKVREDFSLEFTVKKWEKIINNKKND